MASNSFSAIAATNAIVAGIMGLEALKIVIEQFDKCRCVTC
jgi:hypothetical protein